MERYSETLNMAQLSSMRPVTATLVSPLTGQLTTYRRHESLIAIEPATAFDTITMRDSLNTQMYQGSIDGVCTAIRHYQSAIVDFVETDVYLPVETATAGRTSLSLIATVEIIIGLLIALIMAVGIVFSIGMHAWMDYVYPKLYFFRSPDGAYKGFFTREECVTLKASYYPDMLIDPTTTLMVDPSKPGAAEKMQWIIDNTPSDWGLPKDNGVGGIVTWAIIGAVAIAGLYIVVKLVTRKKGE